MPRHVHIETKEMQKEVVIHKLKCKMHRLQLSLQLKNIFHEPISL